MGEVSWKEKLVRSVENWILSPCSSEGALCPWTSNLHFPGLFPFLQNQVMTNDNFAIKLDNNSYQYELQKIRMISKTLKTTFQGR